MPPGILDIINRPLRTSIPAMKAPTDAINKNFYSEETLHFGLEGLSRRSPSRPLVNSENFVHHVPHVDYIEVYYVQTNFCSLIHALVRLTQE